jgi:low temperature requirement protein LtrA
MPGPVDTTGADSGPAVDEEGPHQQRVTWAELFYDLVLVFAVTSVASYAAEALNRANLGRALLLLVPFWWGWVGTALLTNNHEDVDSPRTRLRLFALAGGILLMAVAAPQAYGARGLLFAGGYAAVRVVLLQSIGWHRVTGPLSPYSTAVLVSSPLYLLGGVLHGNARVVLWALAAVSELASPMLLRRRLAGMQFEASHLPERFGLFQIIALGETVVAIGTQASAAGADAGTVAAAVVAFTLICGLWWTYFAFGASAVEHALRTAEVQAQVVREVLSYGHFALVVSIIATAVGCKYVLKHPGDPLTGAELWVLAGGPAGYLATFGYTRWRMFGRPSKTRLPGAAAVLVVAMAASAAPAVVVLASIAAVVIGLNLLESWLVATSRF